MTSHWKAKVGSLAFALAAVMFVASPSYGFWYLFGYPHHSNSKGHYDSCCGPDYGYIYHHQNTHDEPFFHEETGSEHVAAHHSRARVATAQPKKCAKERVTRWTHHKDNCDRCDGHQRACND